MMHTRMLILGYAHMHAAQKWNVMYACQCGHNRLTIVLARAGRRAKLMITADVGAADLISILISCKTRRILPDTVNRLFTRTHNTMLYRKSAWMIMEGPWIDSVDPTSFVDQLVRGLSAKKFLAR